MKFTHKFGVGSSQKTYLQRIFATPLKKLGGKTSHFAKLLLTCRQSEAHNFKTAQHNDKPDVSSTIKR